MHTEGEQDLFAARGAAGVIFHIHENKQDFANGLQPNEIPQTWYCGLKKPKELLDKVS